MIPEGDDETPPGEGPSREHERDVLAERRARRAGAGEAAQLRRADAAEATVHTLEHQLADLRRRQLEAERERERAAEQLADREHELRRVKQREYAEQQLRVEAEENVTRLRRRHRSELDRLQRRVDEARAAMHSTGERAEELRARAEAARVEAEQHSVEAERRHARAEQQRLQAEQECAALAARLAAVSESCARMQEGILVLQSAAAALRAKFEDERQDAHTRIHELERACAAADARARELECALPDTSPAGGSAGSASPEARRDEMAGALAAAVERLRARVAAVDEQGEPTTETLSDETLAAPAPTEATPPAEATPAGTVAAPSPQRASAAELPAIWVVPRVLEEPKRREPWLALAIRRVAERRDRRLAAELVTELLPAQRMVLKRPLSYDLKIAELDGRWRARIGDGHADVGRLPGAGEDGADFLLEGAAADFAELAAGGTGRRLTGLKLHGSRRRARTLWRARRRPLALWDLAAGGIDVWPGLLLLALAEAIDPRWSAGQRFTVAFVIKSPPSPASATLYVQARDGAPLAVTSTVGEERPAATVHVGERAFTCMFAAVPLPAGEHILLEGDTGPLELLLEWTDRAQGRSAGATSLRRSPA